MKLSLEAIVVGERRREDMGDLQALAQSIARHGLIHPIVVAGDNLLVAGGRRLAACRLLGMREVDVRPYGSLSEAERRAIELEENLQRKDLTAHERSKYTAALAETARQVAREEAETCSAVEQVSKPPRGPSRTPGSLRDVAERTGQSPQTILRAEQHVAAGERYPELQRPGIPQREALVMAASLDAMPDTDRDEARAKLAAGDSDTITSLAGLPPMPKDSPAPDRSGERWAKLLHDVYARLRGIRDHGVRSLAGHWSPRDVQLEAQECRRIAAEWLGVAEELEELLNDAAVG